MSHRWFILFCSLANKQDKKNAIKDEDYLKDKLEIEDLKRKHRIVKNYSMIIKGVDIHFYLPLLGILHRNWKRQE